MPSAFFLALALFCLARSQRSRAWTFLLLAGTVFQAFVRENVAFIFGVALFFMSFAGNALRDFGPRVSDALKGAVIAAIGAGVEVYMQFVKHPHLSYTPGTNVVQLRYNLSSQNLLSLALSLLPFAMLALVLMKIRIRLNRSHTRGEAFRTFSDEGKKKPPLLERLVEKARRNYCTVSASDALWVTVPAVAVIVIVDCPVGVPGTGVGVTGAGVVATGAGLLEQPTNKPPAARNTSITPSRRRDAALDRRRRKARIDAKGRSSAEVMPAAYFFQSRGACRAAEAFVV
jgi:hypothetical protein